MSHLHPQKNMEFRPLEGFEGGKKRCRWVFGERLQRLVQGEKGGWKDDGKHKPNQGQNQA